MLRRVASLVKPIMKNRGMRVSSLAEFFPAEKNLLGINVNRGEKICLRLRQPWDQGVFLDVEECVFIMLHEYVFSSRNSFARSWLGNWLFVLLTVFRLAHNTYGPHDDKFYTLLKVLEEEYSALRKSGYDGEGFYSEGHRLGSSGRSKNPRITDTRKRALAAAERRKVHSCVPQKLGGGDLPGVGIREKIAAATERRIRDAQTCGAGSKAGDRGRMEREAEEAIRTGAVTAVVDDENDEETEQAIMKAAIELIEEAEREEAQQRLLWEEKEGAVWIVDDDLPIQVEIPTTEPPPPPPPPTPSATPRAPLDLPPSYEEATTPTWQCEMCTLINPSDLIRCEACSFEPDLSDPVTLPPTPPSPLPQPPPQKKQKVRFAESPVMIPEKKPMWACENCTLVNDAEWWTCVACGVMKLTS
jgi:hypothetical protein